MDHAEHTPGPIALFGSGETSAAGGAAYDALAAQVAGPLKVAVLETPAGFQPNSARVAGKVAEFMQVRRRSTSSQRGGAARRTRQTAPPSPRGWPTRG
jgi:ABC-type sugar transport system substrate-binding protein